MKKTLEIEKDMSGMSKLTGIKTGFNA